MLYGSSRVSIHFIPNISFLFSYFLISVVSFSLVYFCGMICGDNLAVLVCGFVFFALCAAVLVYRSD